MNLIKKKFSLVCLTISILLLLYTFYKSEFYWDGNNRNYYLIYYLISGSLILFSIITFYLNETIKTYLIITLSSIVFTLYAFEAYLTFNDYKRGEELDKKIKLYKELTGKDYDTRTKFRVYKDLKKNDENVVVIAHPRNYIKKQTKIFPLSGISNSKTIYCNENGYYSIYQSDRYGFNNPDSEWDKKELEYLLIGDSYTHGACINRPNDIGSVLRTLSKKAVLNLGYAGNGPLIEYATLREYLKPNVKNILWIYYEKNDIHNLDNELKSQILIKYLQDLNFTQNLKSKQKQIDQIASQMIQRAKSEKNRNFIKLYKIRGIFLKLLSGKHQPQPQLQPQPQPQFKEIIKLAKGLAIKNNSKIYFIYSPKYPQYKSDYDNTSYLLIKTIVEELNIPFFDIHKEVFEKQANPLKLYPFELPGHYNVEGYKKVAEAIHKFISK